MLNKNGKKFLRKKSDLMYDYFLGGVIFSMLGITFYRYNKKVNAPDDFDEFIPSNIYILRKK